MTGPPPGTAEADRATWRYLQAATVAAAPVGGCPRTHQPAGAGRHLLFRVYQGFYLLSCHFRPDRRGHIQRITAGLGFFGHPNAAPPDPPCGEVCPVASRVEACSLSMFCKVHGMIRSEEHTSELQSLRHLVCRLLL